MSADADAAAETTVAEIAAVEIAAAATVAADADAKQIIKNTLISHTGENPVWLIIYSPAVSPASQPNSRIPYLAARIL
jgi:hypothetical protein